MSYIEGFVLPVKRADRERYLAVARKFYDIIRPLGAIRHVECWGDDVPAGQQTDFRRAVALQDDEVVVFSWIEWPSREVREAANRKVMEDPAMQGMDMPFDGKRIVVGGFLPLFDSQAHPA